MTIARAANADGARWKPAAQSKRCVATGAASPREWCAPDRLWSTMSGKREASKVNTMNDIGPLIDNASRDDLAQILAIYNEVIRNSTAVYSEEEFTPARGEVWFDGKIAHGFPMIVARDASGVTGFGSFGEFRAWPC